MDSKRKRALGVRARALIGPLMCAFVSCPDCGGTSEAEYRMPPERFPCAHCGGRRAIREDDDPYPPPMPMREM